MKLCTLRITVTFLETNVNDLNSNFEKNPNEFISKNLDPNISRFAYVCKSDSSESNKVNVCYYLNKLLHIEILRNMILILISDVLLPEHLHLFLQVTFHKLSKHFQVGLLL